MRIMACAFVASMFAPFCSGEALALTEGKTAQRESYVSGGVGLSEREALDKRRPGFSLWVATAARASGAYLSDAHVKISDEAGKAVLDTKLPGPWVLVNLRPGRYAVDVSFGKQTERKTATIHSDDNRAMLFYFDVEAQSLPLRTKN